MRGFIGFAVQGLGFRFSRVDGLRFRVWGFGVWV